MHYYKFNIPDWNLGTGHLSLVEEAVYFRLINFYYDSESPIPIDYFPVLRKLRMADQTEVAALILSEFFVKTDNGYEHSRCKKLLKEFKKNSKTNKENGAKGGRPSKHAAYSETETKPDGFFSETEQEPKHNPNQELLTKNQEPRTKNQKDIISPSAQLSEPEPDQPKKSPKPKKPKAAFVKPTFAELREFFAANGTSATLADDHERFFDYHEAKGWRIGNAPMKSWQAAARTWIRNSKEFNRPRGNKNANTAKSPIERFMQNHYPDQPDQSGKNDFGFMGGDDGVVWDQVDEPVRGDD